MTKRSRLQIWVINIIFAKIAILHVWMVANGIGDVTVLSKLMLCLCMAVLLRSQLRDDVPFMVWTAVLLCMCGDVLLQPLDTDYTNMHNGRDVSFLAGVMVFCAAYGCLARYLLQLMPDWRSRIRAQPMPLLVNAAVTVALLGWMTMHNLAPIKLIPLLWLYSPVVVACATLAVYARGAIRTSHWVALAAGCNIILVSDTIIGLTVFPKLTMPLFSNPVWILSSYAIGICLIFNAVISIQKSEFAIVVKHNALTTR